MSRRSLIFCFSALAAMILVIVAAVAFLYREDTGERVPVGTRYSLAYAVPSNAVMVTLLSEASSLASSLFSAFEFPAELAEFLSSGKAGDIAGNPMAMSMHYSGSLTPLYVFDAGVASDSPSSDAVGLIDFFLQHGFQAEHVNCSELAPSGALASRSLVVAAKTNAQISICRNHLCEGESVMDVSGFADAVKNARGDVLLVPYESAKVLFEKVVSRSYFRKRFPKDASAEYSAAASFFSSLSGWSVMNLDREGTFVCVHDYAEGSDFMSVLDHASPAVSSVSEMLPSYTCFALTLPMGNAAEYISSYSAYLESSKSKVSNQDWQTRLKKKSGLAPHRLFERLGVKEVASASFMCGSALERVNLLKMDYADTVLLRGTSETSFGDSPKVLSYRFADHIASVFGKYFRLEDESHFACINGWLVTGSRQAVDEYVSGRALEYPLDTYMADAGADDLLAERMSSCVVYANFPKADAGLADILNKEVRNLHDVFKTAEYSPVVVSVFSKNGVMHSDILTYQLERIRSRAPKYERDTVVTVPQGPFKVINSGTGKTNLFYQQNNGAICLKEEGGKGLWGVPFKHSLCGTAQNIDYYANGNKQILFGAASSLYLIDRMGRFVKGFPVDLGKEILIGPDVYDFNGVNSYNVLVLHKDNTVEMYNLHGKKPDSWKGIYPPENNTIKSLPERLMVDGKTFWVVRTSMQTLIYPFYGGEPLTKLQGDAMFIPTAEVKVINSTTVEAECYDGRKRTVKVK